MKASGKSLRNELRTGKPREVLFCCVNKKEGNYEPFAMPTPLQDRVLVRRIEEDHDAKLIMTPEAYRQKPLKAEVLKVGPGKRRSDDSGDYFIPTQVKAGQTVLLSPTVNMGNWSDIIEGSGVTMIQEADILGVIEG